MASAEANNFATLKQLIEGNNDINYVYLTDNIVYTSGGINVPKNKGDITIDGNGFSMTDYNVNGTSNTIYVSNSGGVVNVTLKNMTFFGRNYYGMVAFAEGAINEQATLFLENVDYSGPQAVWHRRGKIHAKNSSFRIGPYNQTSSEIDEFCETNHLILEGDIYIDSTVTRSMHACIFFTYNNPVFDILEDANVTIVLPSTYLIYSDYPIACTVGNNAKVDINCEAGMFYSTGGSSHVMSSFVLNQGSYFSIIQNGYYGNIGTIRIQSALTLNDNSTLIVKAPMSQTPPSIQFTSNSTININNPANLVLYNKANTVISFSGTTNNINFNTELLSVWDVANDLSVAGTFADPPLHGWQKANDQNITANMAVAGNTVTTITTNVNADDYGGVLNTSTFQLASTKVLACGSINADLNNITDATNTITGTTRPSAFLKATLNGQENDGQALTNGEIAMPLTIEKAVGDLMVFKINWSFLTKIMVIEIIGSLRITYVPSLMPFGSHAIPLNKEILYRMLDEWYIEVTDTRTLFTPWDLYVVAEGPLNNGNVSLDDDTMIYVKGSVEEVVSTTPVLIFQKLARLNVPEITTIPWSKVEGILLSVNPFYVYDTGQYMTTLEWFLEETT